MIRFHQADIEFRLPNPNLTRKWIERVASEHSATIEELNFVFCSDDYLLNINRQFLQHDTYTDIITFPEGTTTRLAGEIYISIDRVKENATTFQAEFLFELRRVIIHGVLHLLGFKDKSPGQTAEMRRKETESLSLFPRKQVSRGTSAG